jgi:hypothetical protein
MKKRVTRRNGLALSLVLVTLAVLGCGPALWNSVHAAAPTLLFSDDFQDGNYTIPPWTVSGSKPWTVGTDPADASNKILLQGVKGSNAEAYAAAGDPTWTDYSYEARVR